MIDCLYFLPIVFKLDLTKILFRSCAPSVKIPARSYTKIYHPVRIRSGSPGKFSTRSLNFVDALRDTHSKELLLFVYRNIGSKYEQSIPPGYGGNSPPETLIY